MGKMIAVCQKVVQNVDLIGESKLTTFGATNYMFKSGVFQNTLQGPPHCAAADSFFSLSTRRKQGSRNVRQGSLVAKVDRKVREESICVKDLRPYEKKLLGNTVRILGLVV